MTPGQLEETKNYLYQLLTSRKRDGSGREAYAVIPRDVPVDVSPTPTTVEAFEVPYMLANQTNTTASDPRIGYAGLEFYPNPLAPFWFLQNTAITSDVIMTGYANGMTAMEGLWPTTVNSFDENYVNNVLEMDNADELNIVCSLQYDNDQSGIESPMRRFVAADGKYAYGVPYDSPAGASTLTIAVGVNSSLPMPAGTNFSLKLVSKYGQTAWVPGPIPLATANVTWGGPGNTISFAGAVASLGGRYATVLPDEPIGVRIRCDTGSVVATQVSLFLRQLGNSVSSRMVPFVPRYANQLGYIEQYAPASMQPWIQFVGSDLNNAGSWVASAYSGGIPPTLAGYSGYSSIAQMRSPASFPVKLGAYGVWRPCSVKDVTFRNPTDAISYMTGSSIMWYAKVGAAQSNISGNLLLHLWGEGESTTQDPTRQTIRCIANPFALVLAIAAIANYPEWTENPLHWGDIKAFTKKVFGALKDGAAFFNEHKGWIIPAVTTLAALA